MLGWLTIQNCMRVRNLECRISKLKMKHNTRTQWGVLIWIYIRDSVCLDLDEHILTKINTFRCFDRFKTGSERSVMWLVLFTLCSPRILISFRSRTFNPQITNSFIHVSAYYYIGVAVDVLASSHKYIQMRSVRSTENCKTCSYYYFTFALGTIALIARNSHEPKQLLLGPKISRFKFRAILLV